MMLDVIIVLGDLTMRFLILADSGNFESVEKAAFSEKTINWWDDKDFRQQNCVECYAAIEISEHLKQAGCTVIVKNAKTGDRSCFDAVLLIGKSTVECEGFSTDKEGRDGTYKTLSHNSFRYVLVWGSNCYGTLHASYEWLASIGFRWYTPDKNGTIIPNNISITDCEQELDYDYRTRGCYNEFIDDDNPGFLDWASRNGMNMLRVNKLFNPEGVKKRGLSIMSGGHEIFYKYLNPNTEYPYNTGDRSANDRDRSGKPDDTFMGTGLRQKENSKKMVTYFDAHPEWFALINGKRSSRDENIRATEGYYTGDNICTSNAGAVKELAKNMLESLNTGDYRYCDYLNLWAYDNGTWCECENCINTGNLSRRMLILAYDINKIIKKAYKNGETGRRIKLVVPIYHETLEPPDIQLPDDFDYEHIIITYFPIERCYAHNIDDESCTETNLQLKKLYEKWTDPKNGYYAGDIFIGEYYNVSSFASLPFLFTDSMMNDIPYYFRTGTRHLYYMHISARNWGMLMLNNCVLSGLFKSINFDIKEFFNELYSKFYPVTGEKMKKFHEFLKKASVNSKYLKHYQFAEDGSKLSLIGKIVEEEKFPLKHCKFNSRTNDPNNSLSFSETMDLLEKASVFIYEAEQEATGIESERIVIEKMRYDYGLKVMRFIYNYTILRMAVDNHKKEKVYEYFNILEKIRIELMEISKPLEEMKYECPWYENAYKATWHDKSYEKLRLELLRN